MRTLTGILFSSLLIFVAGCSTPKATPPLAQPATATLAVHLPGSPVLTKADAETVANELMQGPGGIQWSAPPVFEFVQEMSYEDAQRMIGVGEPEYDRWLPETRVWLVVVSGSCLVTPLDPNQANPEPLPYEGCLFSLFAAQDGEIIALGDAVCSAVQ